ncbi:sulfatase-like hydrolase/transferase [Halorussus limi]|uniref:Sulfatase-like hydrolase/transferase n=1 Tax=Halorussus limi TaxID=2938695 RepID=A0A8U0HWU2_9EURY|nr:sulfatase-like hydrolase/transferase [Halorussus limi]UPV75243.1 sulfatase-like hydrolase/transferase [Halorussus limi]
MSDEPNVFILSADSLNQQYFSDFLPELADLVNAVDFTDAIATASDTNSAMPGLATSVYSDSVPGWGLPDEDPPVTIAERLAKSGYDCGLWTDNYLFGEEYNYTTGFSAGNLGTPTWKKRLVNAIRESPFEQTLNIAEWVYFNVFSQLKGKIASEESFYRTAEDLHSSALEWIRTSNDSPTFCWIHYMDTHHPYEPPSDYLNPISFNESRSRSKLGEFTRNVIKANGEGFSDSEIEDVRKAYRASCRYLFEEVRRFIQILVEENHFKPSKDVLVFTADHGECLSPREHGVMGHVPPAFWEEIVNVPLLVSRPNWDRETVEGQVSLIDVMPTILDAVGVDIPGSAEGTAWRTPKDAVVEQSMFVSEWQATNWDSRQTYRGVRTDAGWKLFGAHKDGTDVGILARRSPEDSEEEVYIGDSNPMGEFGDRWHELSAELDRGPILGTDEKIETEDSVEDHLRDLGYVE